MVCMTLWDFVSGVLFGIVVSCTSGRASLPLLVCSCATSPPHTLHNVPHNVPPTPPTCNPPPPTPGIVFVVQTSHSRSIRALYTGDSALSTVRRPSAQRAYVREVAKQTVVLKLQGHLFFGTITQVEARIRALLTSPSWRHNPVRFLIVDLSLVAGVDLSAAEAFLRVQRLLAARGVIFVLCGAAAVESVRRALEGVELFGEEGVETFGGLNEALECECHGSVCCVCVFVCFFFGGWLSLFRWLTVTVSFRWLAVSVVAGWLSRACVCMRFGCADACFFFFSFRCTGTENAYLKAWLMSRKNEGGRGDAIAFPGRHELPLQLAESIENSPRRAHLRDAGGRIFSSGATNPDPEHPLHGEPYETLLRAFSSHGPVDPAIYRPLLPYLTRVAAPAGELLFTQGEPSDALYLIQAGVLRASYRFGSGLGSGSGSEPSAAGASADADACVTVEESMVAGTLAGELSAVSGTTRNATVVVERDAVLWRLGTEDLRRLENERPELARAFVRLILKSAKVDYDTLIAALAARQ
ncbi:hypothetical protein K439DRAFT_882735 [Ramaria rubella]|nr:hypothetical protein K439DRAFT_882735 [Ramaria rubella]